METVADTKIAQRGSVLRVGTVAAVFILLVLACWAGWESGTTRAQAEATYEGVVQIHAALADYQADQEAFPSAYQFTGQSILALLYIPTMPVPKDVAGMCAKYPAFTYALVGSQNYALTFCLTAPVANLSAGVHTLSSGGVDLQASQ